MAIPKVGSRLRRARKAANLSRRQLDLKAGISVGLTGLIESGERGNPTLETLSRLAKALGVKVSWLIGEDAETPGPAATGTDG